MPTLSKNIYYDWYHACRFYMKDRDLVNVFTHTNMTLVYKYRKGLDKVAVTIAKYCNLHSKINLKC